MPYTYFGTSPRTYPQYRDTATWATLCAEPGQAYDMVPVAGAEAGLTVPPPDGQWGTEPVTGPPLVPEPEPEPEPAVEPEPRLEPEPEPEPERPRKAKAGPPPATTRTSKAGRPAKEG